MKVSKSDCSPPGAVHFLCLHVWTLYQTLSLRFLKDKDNFSIKSVISFFPPQFKNMDDGRTTMSLEEVAEKKNMKELIEYIGKLV